MDGSPDPQLKGPEEEASDVLEGSVDFGGCLIPFKACCNLVRDESPSVTVKTFTQINDKFVNV